MKEESKHGAPSKDKERSVSINITSEDDNSTQQSTYPSLLLTTNQPKQRTRKMRRGQRRRRRQALPTVANKESYKTHR